MKKILVASTALVAAGMITAGSASASEKIKLNLGGYSKWWVVGAWQDDDFQNSGTRDFNSVDIKGDNEIFFSGSTKLDNGIEVGVNVELEAGGTTDNTADTIDKSYVYLSGGFGKVIVGTEANGTALLHVMAPDAAGNIDSDGILTGGLAIAKPDAVATQVVSSIDTDGDADKITYVAPTFYGLTLGASYVPNSSQDNRGATNIRTQTTGEIYGVGGLYANTFGGVGVKVSAGWATYDTNGTERATPTADDQVNEYAFGTQLSYAGFTLGGAYRLINSDDGIKNGLGGVSNDGNTWDIGLMYETGPYAVSFFYLQSEAEGTVGTAGEDKFTVYQVSGKYNMGAGVDLLATIGHAEYEDEVAKTAANAGDHNEGWSVMTGLSLQF